jgi:hypothetical protein
MLGGERLGDRPGEHDPDGRRNHYKGEAQHYESARRTQESGFIPALRRSEGKSEKKMNDGEARGQEDNLQNRRLPGHRAVATLPHPSADIVRST